MFPLMAGLSIDFSRSYFSILSHTMPMFLLFNIINALLMLLLGRVHRYLPLIQLAANGFLLGVFWSLWGIWIQPHMPFETTAIILCAHVAYSRKYRLFPPVVILLACAAFLESTKIF
ncbi:MAG: hypothetical protein ACRCY4_08815 [Brevinema sp.]